MKKIAAILGLILILCICFSTITLFFISLLIVTPSREDIARGTDTLEICNDKELVVEIKNKACEDYEQEIARDIFVADTVANKYAIGKNSNLIIYKASKPGILQGVHLEEVMIQYNGKFIAETELNDLNFNHGDLLSAETKVLWKESTYEIVFYFNDPLENENFQIFKFNKILNTLSYFDFEELAEGITFDSVSIDNYQSKITLFNKGVELKEISWIDLKEILITEKANPEEIQY